MKLALVTTIYKRHDLEQIVLDRFRNQAQKFGFEIVVVGSEGDISKRLAEGCHYVEHENYPVSDKHNAALAKVKELDVDGIVVMGSDDLVTDSYWQWLYSVADRNEPAIIGLRDLYFYSTESKTLGYFAGFQNGKQTTGAGRFYSRAILERLDWKLWRSGINNGLDSSANDKVKQPERAFDMTQAGCILVDVKHTRNISLAAILNLCQPASAETFAGAFPEEFEKIVRLSSGKSANIEENRTFNPGERVQFESNGVSKYLPRGFKEMTIEQARLLYSKGYETY